MTKKEENTYQIFNNSCLRTPLLSFSEYKRNIEKEEIIAIDFKEILKDEVFREALFLASPELFHQIERWEEGNLNNLQKIERLQTAVLKYFTRISTRCTPFGLFASCSVGAFGLETSIQLNNHIEYTRCTRFDTTFLNQLFQELLKNKDIKENVLFYPNTSLYSIGNHYRYVEYSIEKKKRVYSIEGVNHAVYLEKILEEALQGKNIEQLATILIDDEVTLKEAKYFVEELIENQILVSELEITVTGDDYFKNLLNSVRQIPKASKIYNQLAGLQKQLTKLDAKIGNDVEVYQSIMIEAKKLIPALDSKYLFQTDTFTTFKNNTLDKNIKRQLKKAFVLFNKMTLPSAKSNIEQFKRDFLKRFEQAEVPLNLVLDVETGIGYGDKKEDTNDLLDDLSLFETKKRYERVIWTDVDTILQKKLVNATQNKKYTITLTEDDFKETPTTWDDLPDTFSSIIEISKSENGERIFIKGTSGASATYLLGRFSNGDKKLLESIHEIVTIEERINSGKILAEIVHLPEARTGNILQRASFRAYEIPYLGKSSTANKYQISIEDLFVSIQNDTIILRSKKLNKEILPRLGNAHNYGANPLPIYQFLCEIQTQNKRPSIGFSWNPILEKQPFLPRVTFENMVFSKAKWRIEVSDFKSLFNTNNLFLSIKKWQKKNMIPDLVELVEGDNKLLINLKSKISMKLLLDTIKNKKQFLLEEFLFSDDEIVKNEKGLSFCNQFVVSFYNEAKLKATKND